MEDGIRWIRTHCSRMDHGGCAIRVGVRDGRVVKIAGDPEGFLNRGYVCPKGLALGEKLEHPDRLRRPLRRTGKRGAGKWEAISWEAAFNLVCQGLDRTRRAFGAKSVAFCQGMPKGMEHFALIRLANLFGSPNVVAVQDVCHAPREVTGLHTCGFYPVADLHHDTEAVLVWGGNPLATNEEGQIGRNLLDRLKAGAKLTVVDPRRTKLAARADHWLPIRPGADAALALAFLHVVIAEALFDREFVAEWCHGFQVLAEHVRAFTPEALAADTGVDPEAVRAAARCYATARPAALAWGNAVEQTPHAFDAVRALVSLMAVCGNLDVPGGNVATLDPPILGLGPFVRAKKIPDKPKEMLHAAQGTIPRLMTVPPVYFRRAVLESDPYPVRAAYLQTSNPMLSYADANRTRAALESLDFFAVSDVFMTPTAAMADVVLPAATGLEFDDIGHYGLGHGYILARPKAVDPPEECRPDVDILTELGRRLTDPAEWPETGAGLLDEVLAPTGMDFGAFAEAGYLKGPDRFRKYAEKGFRTPSGKVELVLSKAEAFGLPALPEWERAADSDAAFPLWLTSCKSPDYLHSSYRWVETLRKRSPAPEAVIHPETAAEMGIGDGEMVWIETAHGRIEQTARLSDGVRRDTVHAGYGWWFPEAGAESLFGWERANLNRLTTVDEVGKAFGTPRLRGVRCRVGRVAG
jgi:anaerobic selenocysteine-containing dehydrogenase